MKLCLSALSAVAWVVLAVPAMAHHSFNTFFDMSRTVQIEGIVKSFSKTPDRPAPAIWVSSPIREAELHAQSWTFAA